MPARLRPIMPAKRRARLPLLVLILLALAAAGCASSPAAPRATNAGAATLGVRTTARTTCRSTLAGRLASTARATQVITVEASSYATTHATLTLWQRQGSCWVSTAGPWPARIGTHGFSNHHVEGDGTTPTGSYGIGPVMYGNAPNPGVHYAYHRLVCGDWWDEAPSSPGYNRFVHVACGQEPPFAGDSEALWTETAAYPSLAVVEYNTAPIRPGAGSGIFIHADIGVGTAGCVSVPLPDLDTLLRRLQPADSPRIVMGPSSEITRF